VEAAVHNWRNIAFTPTVPIVVARDRSMRIDRYVGVGWIWRKSPAKLSRFYHVKLFTGGASHFATWINVFVSL
jgi:hypothetical protein